MLLSFVICIVTIYSYTNEGKTARTMNNLVVLNELSWAWWQVLNHLTQPKKHKRSAACKPCKGCYPSAPIKASAHQAYKRCCPSTPLKAAGPRPPWFLKIINIICYMLHQMENKPVFSIKAQVIESHLPFGLSC